jgi:arylsulfatase A-like enzyme
MSKTLLLFASLFVLCGHLSGAQNMLMGRYQNRFGHEFNASGAHGMSLTETTIVQRLKAAGYATDLVGKRHLGADTFWEVYVPGDDFLSPYNSHLMNSYCHAWSCTPTYFLRRQAP